MICNNCGAEIPEGIFCPECGTRVVDEPPEEKPVQPPAQNTEKEIELAKIELEKERLKNERMVQELEKERVLAEQKNQERAFKEQEAKEKAAKQKQEAEIKAAKREQFKADNQGKVMGTLSLICGFIAIFTLGAAFLPEILGIIFALKGKKNGVMWGTAKAGLILSVLSIPAFIIAVIVCFAL